MGSASDDTYREPERLTRKMFVVTSLGVCLFVTLVVVVLRYMPNNNGLEPAPTPIVAPRLASQH